MNNNIAATIDNIIRFKNGNLCHSYYDMCNELSNIAKWAKYPDVIRIYPNRWVKSRGRYKLLSFEGHLVHLLKSCNIDYNHGNSKRGGRESDYIELKKPDMRLSFWKYWRAFRWDT